MTEHDDAGAFAGLCTRATHPLDGWLRLITTGQDHAGFNATLLPTADGARILLVWRSALTHAACPGAELKLLVSHDECASFAELRSIYASADWDTRNFAGGVMGAGRAGLVAARFRGAGATLKFGLPLFLFSDDGGATWQGRDLPAPDDEAVSFHGDILRWPTSAGGHDEMGFVAFSYNHWRKAIDGLYTRDNGESWVWRTDLCVTDGVLASQLTECWTAAVGPDGPWIMAVRPTTSGQLGPVILYVSRDLTLWEGPRDGGVLLSGNAPALIVENGEAHLYTVSRRGAKRELPNERGEMLGDRLLLARAPAAALVAGETDFAATGGWRELGPLPEHAVGYIFPRRIRERWFAVFNFGETGSVGSSEVKRSWLGLMAPHRPVVVDAPALRAAQSCDNILDNGDFSVWNRGERFDSVPPGRILADRWTARHPAADMTVAERIVRPHPFGGPRHWLRKACSAPTGRHSTVQTLGQVDLGAGNRVTMTLRARAAAGPGLVGLRLVQDFGVGGAPAQTIALAHMVRLCNEPLLYSFAGVLPPVEGKVCGPGAALRLEIDECREAGGAAYDVVYGEASLILSSVVAHVRSRSEAETRAACARWGQVLPLRALATGAGARGAALLQIAFAPMARPPVARLRGYDGAGLADAVALALSEREAAFLVGPRPVGELVEAVLELDAEWTEPLNPDACWIRDPQTPDLASVPAEGLFAPAIARACLAPTAQVEDRPGLIDRIKTRVALEGELRALELARRPGVVGRRRALRNYLDGLETS